MKRASGAWLGVVCHAVVVFAMAGQLLWWDLHPTIDANIGAGFLMLALMAMGFPWSMAAFGWIDASQTVTDLAIIATAVLNIVLHWALIRWLRGRTTSNKDAVAS